jgi:hypothetical protein
MPEKTIKRRLQDCDAALASDDGPMFSTVAQAGRGAQAFHSRRNAKRGAKKKKPCALASELLR